MIFEYGDMMAQPRSARHPLVVTTNGTIKKDGSAVMGAGIAKQVRDSIRQFDVDLGHLLSQHGNRPFRVRDDIWTLPVKHQWFEQADLALIGWSLLRLEEMAEKFDVSGLHLPRPGCGNGGLDWVDVEPLVREFSDALPDVEVIVWDYSKPKDRKSVV